MRDVKSELQAAVEALDEAQANLDLEREELAETIKVKQELEAEAAEVGRERAKLLEDWSEAADERRKLVADFAAQFTPAGLTAFVEEADGQRAEAERRSKARLGELLAAKEALQAKLAFRRETEALILDLETSKKGLQERIAELEER